MNPVKELKTLIREVHEQQAAAGCDLHAMETARIIEMAHPQLMDEYAQGLRSRGLVKMCADDIRSLQAVTQETIDGLGLELPMVVTIHDGEGGFAHRPIHRATLSDFDADVTIKGENVAAAQAKYDAARRAARILRSAPGASDSMMVTEAVRLLQSQEAA
jgi:hypothetical protein